MFDKRGMAIGLTTLAAAVFAGSAEASIVNFVSNPGLEGLGAFAGSMEWTDGGAGSGLLRVTLTNTSPVANGGYLTGFAFRMLYKDQVKIEYASSHPGWSGIADAPCNPFGVFDIGAALGGNWLGGGSPLAGIAVGATKSFDFDVHGSAALLSTIIAHDFFDESDGYGFVARFRGFEDGGSDKVPASMPAPGALAALALGALGSSRRRR
jgi:MYXO-CTERM domain-containing protein